MNFIEKLMQRGQQMWPQQIGQPQMNPVVQQPFMNPNLSASEQRRMAEMIQGQMPQQQMNPFMQRMDRQGFDERMAPFMNPNLSASEQQRMAGMMQGQMDPGLQEYMQSVQQSPQFANMPQSQMQQLMQRDMQAYQQHQQRANNPRSQLAAHQAALQTRNNVVGNGPVQPQMSPPMDRQAFNQWQSEQSVAPPIARPVIDDMPWSRPSPQAAQAPHPQFGAQQPQGPGAMIQQRQRPQPQRSNPFANRRPVSSSPTNPLAGRRRFP